VVEAGDPAGYPAQCRRRRLASTFTSANPG